jgi:alpha-tubulin suppressor-like RCC1 family protein
VLGLYADYVLRDDGYLLHQGTTGEAMIVDSAGAALSGVQTAFGGETHGCAALSDGSVACWPLNAQGNLFVQLGADVPVPDPFHAVTVHTSPSTLLGSIDRVASGTFGSDMIVSCAVAMDSTLYCWGNTTDLLNNGAEQHSVFARQVSRDAGSVLDGVLDAAISTYGACALIDGASENEIWCWGANQDGEAGTGDRVRVRYPTRVQGLVNPSAVVRTSNAACALEGDTVKCWGGNRSGECGANSPDEVILAPTLVKTSEDATLTGVVAIASGPREVCAMRSDGSLFCWGNVVTRRHAVPYELGGGSVSRVTLVGAAATPRFMRANGRYYLGQTSRAPSCSPP